MTAAAGDGQVTLTWTDLSDTTITKWEYRYKVKTASVEGSWTEFSTSASATTYTVPSLTNGTEYTFQVRASNGSGAGTASEADDATPVGAPGATNAPDLTPGDKQLGVSWSEPADTGGRAITDYDVEYRSGNSGDWTSHPHDGTTTSATIAGLSNGQSYQVRVRAVNDKGDGGWSDAASAAPVPVPAQPVVTAAAGDGQVTLTWTDLSDTTITKWEYRYKVKTASVEGSWTEFSTSASATTYTVPSLTNGTEYTFQVRASNASGAGTASEADDATPVGAPGATNAPDLTPGDKQLGVSWSEPADTGGRAITDYDVEYRSGNSGDWTSHPHDGTTTSATIAGLSNGQSYQVRVRAVNDKGDGGWSDAASARRCRCRPSRW